MNDMNRYDGVFRKPFLAEHWYKGFVGAAAMWLPVFLLLNVVLELDDTTTAVITSGISLLLLVAAVTHYERFTLEPDQYRYRRYTWVLGLRFGTWQKLPSISHITLRPSRQQHSLPTTEPSSPVKLQLTASENTWQVLLSVNHSPIGIVAAYGSYQKAAFAAQRLSDTLKVDVQNSPHG